MNLDNPKPIAWKAISTGGNLVKIVSAPRTIEAIDFTKPLPSIDEVWQKPWLIHWATEETVDLLPFTATVDGAHAQGVESVAISTNEAGGNPVSDLGIEVGSTG